MEEIMRRLRTENVKHGELLREINDPIRKMDSS